MKLYDSDWAPSPRKVRIFLAEKGIQVERIMLDLRANEQTSAEFLAINPRGMVPTLLLDNGVIIDESNAICRYFEALYPEHPLFGTSPQEIALIEAWSRRIEHDCYSPVANALRNSLPAFKNRPVTGQWPPMPQIPALAERGEIMFHSFTQAANQQLSTHSYIAGEQYSFADITLLVALDFAKIMKLAPVAELANIARWYTKVTQRKSADA